MINSSPPESRSGSPSDPPDEPPAQQPRGVSPLQGLTNREQEILGLIGQGLTIPEIAERLFRSQKTIESHRQSLGRKLQVGNRVELARIAIQTGLAPLEPMTGLDCPTVTPRQRLSSPQASEAYGRIDAACSDAVGPHYLRCLVQHITRDLDVAGSIVSHYDVDTGHFRSLAFCHRGQWQDDLTLDLDKAPCSNTLRDGFWHVDVDLPERFPGFAYVNGLTLYSYLGLRLDGGGGRPLGALMVYQDEPRPITVAAREVFQSLARRVAGEVKRVVFTERLQRRIEELEAAITKHESRTTKHQ